MSDLDVTRLLLSPMGQPAPEGAPGDIVRVSDGTVTLYMDPAEHDAGDDRTIRYLLASQGTIRG